MEISPGLTLVVVRAHLLDVPVMPLDPLLQSLQEQLVLTTLIHTPDSQQVKSHNSHTHDNFLKSHSSQTLRLKF